MTASYYIQINNDRLFFNKIIVLLYLLGFRWATHHELSKPSDMFITFQTIRYVVPKIEKENLILRYRSRPPTEENMLTGSELTFEDLFTILNTAYKQFNQIPTKPTRLDINNNPCITISEDCDLVFKQNQIHLYSIDPEVEYSICSILQNNYKDYKDVLNTSVNNFQNEFSFKPEFKKIVIQEFYKR